MHNRAVVPTATQTEGNQSGQTLLSQNPTGVKLHRRLIVKHGFNWCEIHSSDLWSFRWSEILWLGRIWFIHEESRNVNNSKLDWAVVFTARYARRNRKTVHLGARLRKPSRPLPTYLATTRAIHQGAEAGQSARGISVRNCVNRQRRSRTCWPTLGSHGNRSWQEYCGICTDAVN